MIELDGHDDGGVRFFRQRPLGSIRDADNRRARFPRLASQLHNLRALAAPRNDDHRGVLGKRGKAQQLVGIEQVHRMPVLMKHRANVQRRMPAAPNSR